MGESAAGRYQSRRADHHQGLGAVAAGAQEAAKAPRLHVVVEEPIEVSSSMDDALVDELQRMGHRVERNARIGGG
ncbi:MAG: hypothetical protein OSB73_08740, partial [Candidatus Latescibacteria bacterium]|nr:hypothetical protein [Candidatus Latescibacterota bacterium]